MVGKNHQHDSVVDFTKGAAEHLREEAKAQGLNIGSSHAHALVAASLGYQSRVALLASSAEHSIDDPWLYREEPNREELGAAVARMRKGDVKPEHIPFLAQAIRDGLAPACVESGLRSAENIPLGYVHNGDDATDVEWVYPTQAQDRQRFGHCLCCGSGFLYRVEDLSEKGLCDEHEDEFDLDEDEAKDREDFVEYMTKDL